MSPRRRRRPLRTESFGHLRRRWISSGRGTEYYRFRSKRRRSFHCVLLRSSESDDRLDHQTHSITHTQNGSPKSFTSDKPRAPRIRNISRIVERLWRLLMEDNEWIAAIRRSGREIDLERIRGVRKWFAAVNSFFFFLCFFSEKKLPKEKKTSRESWP